MFVVDPLNLVCTICKKDLAPAVLALGCGYEEIERFHTQTHLLQAVKDVVRLAKVAVNSPKESINAIPPETVLRLLERFVK